MKQNEQKNNPMKANQFQRKREANRLVGLLIGAAALCWCLFVVSAEEEKSKSAELAELKRAASWASSLEDPVTKGRFEALVRKLALRFQEVPYSERYGTNHFVKIVLNQKGGQFDGIRLKVSSSEDRELVWVFGLPQSAAKFTWYILDMKTSMQGFRSFTASDGPGGAPLDEFAPWGKLTEKHRSFLQTLWPGKVRAGGEYVIWFKFKDEKPVELFLAINLIKPDELPPKTYLSYGPEMEKALGFNRGSTSGVQIIRP